MERFGFLAALGMTYTYNGALGQLRKGLLSLKWSVVERGSTPNHPCKACPRENGEQGAREGAWGRPVTAHPRIKYGAGYEWEGRGVPAGVGIANAR